MQDFKKVFHRKSSKTFIFVKYWPAIKTFVVYIHCGNEVKLPESFCLNYSITAFAIDIRQIAIDHYWLSKPTVQKRPIFPRNWSSKIVIWTEKKIVCIRLWTNWQFPTLVFGVRKKKIHHRCNWGSLFVMSMNMCQQSVNALSSTSNWKKNEIFW